MRESCVTICARIFSLTLSVSACAVTFSILGGCSRSKYRIAADHEAYSTIAERNCDPRWSASNYSIDIDPRSRYFDSYDPDRPPMPRDDPTAHAYMHCVDGMKGWQHWHDNGVRLQLENPAWQVQLAGYAEVEDDGAVILDVDKALQLAYVHSPNHQSQLETLYLSALDVTTERFRLDSQFFGGYDLNYVHQGSLIPPAVRFDPVSGRYIINPAIDGVESNRLAVGRSGLGNPALQASRRFATAGQLLVGFANSFVFEFTGADANLSASLANFSFLQPLLRGAGRDIALEQLTFTERLLLANLRAYAQFRQGFYTQVAIGELGVVGPARFSRGTNLTIFSGQGGLGGYVGLLQQLQQIRNAEDNLDLQVRTLAQLVALLDVGLIDLVQVDQFRQNVERDRANLLQQRNNYERQLDTYKTSTLGLPPDLLISLDDELIQQFQLVDREATETQNAIADIKDRLGADLLVADEAALAGAGQADVYSMYAEALTVYQPLAYERMDELEAQLDQSIADVAALEEPAAQRLETMDEDDRTIFENELTQLDGFLEDLKLQYANIASSIGKLQNPPPSPDVEEQSDAQLQLESPSAPARQSQVESDNLQPADASTGADASGGEQAPSSSQPDDDTDGTESDETEPEASAQGGNNGAAVSPEQNDTSAATQPQAGEQLVAPPPVLAQDLPKPAIVKEKDDTVNLLQNMLRFVQSAILVQARARLESVRVEPIDLKSGDAFQIALANRLDFMNGRAALVDSWRLIQVNADALQSVLNATGGGDIRTARNNPLSFRAPTANLRLGLEFDAPFTRLIERNAYRESLITYQRNRRAFIQSRDALHLDLRILLRQIEQLKENLEIQRRSVAIAIRRVDLTRSALYAPVRPPQPGQRPATFGPTAAINLLSAQSALRDTQNAFLTAWLSYYAARMRLARELGTMSLDVDGRWLQTELPTSGAADDNAEEVDAAQPAEDMLELPPPVPQELLQTLNSLPDDFTFEVPTEEPPAQTQASPSRSIGGNSGDVDYDSPQGVQVSVSSKPPYETD